MLLDLKLILLGCVAAFFVGVGVGWHFKGAGVKAVVVSKTDSVRRSDVAAVNDAIVTDRKIGHDVQQVDIAARNVQTALRQKPAVEIRYVQVPAQQSVEGESETQRQGEAQVVCDAHLSDDAFSLLNDLRAGRAVDPANLGNAVSTSASPASVKKSE